MISQTPSSQNIQSGYRNIVDAFMADRARRSFAFDMGQPHYHPYYELYYLISGKCKMFVNHTIYYLSAGDVMILPPNQLHRTLYDSKQISERLTANFIPEYIAYFSDNCSTESFAQIFSHQKLSIPLDKQSYVERLFTQMLKETVSADAYSKIQIQSSLFQLLTFLGRCQNTEQPPQLLPEEDVIMQDVAHFIYTHHREPLSLKAAAEQAHMSSAWFSKKFHQTVGLGFKEYLTHVRLEDGAKLLLSTNLSVTEIAVTCGFSNGNYFGDAFRKAYGMSPREYRFARHSVE